MNHTSCFACLLAKETPGNFAAVATALKDEKHFFLGQILIRSMLAPGHRQNVFLWAYKEPAKNIMKPFVQLLCFLLLVPFSATASETEFRDTCIKTYQDFNPSVSDQSWTNVCNCIVEKAVRAGATEKDFEAAALDPEKPASSKAIRDAGQACLFDSSLYVEKE